jgi:hypothetical protein
MYHQKDCQNDAGTAKIHLSIGTILVTTKQQGDDYSRH